MGLFLAEKSLMGSIVSLPSVMVVATREGWGLQVTKAPSQGATLLPAITGGMQWALIHAFLHCCGLCPAKGMRGAFY